MNSNYMVSFSIPIEPLIWILSVYIIIVFVYGYKAPLIWVKNTITWIKCKMVHREEKVDFK